LRLGVPLSPLKARLFDVVARAGATGIAGDDLFAIALGDRRASRMSGLKAHVWQINAALAATGYRIAGRGGFFRLIGPEGERWKRTTGDGATTTARRTCGAGPAASADR